MLLNRYWCFLLILSTLTSHSQQVLRIISNDVGLVSYNIGNTNKMSSGTGTLILKMNDTTTGSVFLITNRHVLPLKNENDSIHFQIKKSSGVLNSYVDIAIPIFDTMGALSETVKFDPDTNDLAVINITDIYIQKGLRYLDSSLIPYTLLATKEIIVNNDIGIGDEILFVGYPSLFYDKRNFSPLMRSGIIASSPIDDYYFNDLYRMNYYVKSKEVLPEKLKGFLIDGSVLHGSSGSLVFLKPQAFKLRNGAVNMGQGGTPYILGVLTNTYFDISSNSGERANIGGVISSEQVKKTIDLFKYK